MRDSDSLADQTPAAPFPASAISVAPRLSGCCSPDALAASWLPGTASSSRHCRTASYCVSTACTALTRTSHRVRQRGRGCLTGPSSASAILLNADRAVIDELNSTPSSLTTCRASRTVGHASLTFCDTRFTACAPQWTYNANGCSLAIIAWHPRYWPLMLLAPSYVWPCNIDMDKLRRSSTSFMQHAMVAPVVFGGSYRPMNSSWG